ncbi:MAG: nuclear transport factor 2 family protein [Labilithrix sp.]
MNNADRIHAIYAAFGKGDIATIVETTAEDVDWGYDGEPPAVLAWLKAGKGRQRVLEYFDGVMKTMDFHAFVPRVVAAQGHEVATMVEVDFTSKTTGKRVKGIQAMWFTLDDRGRITRYRIVLDSAAHFAAYA